MSHHTLGWLQTCGHEKGRPIDAVETDDLLAHQLHIGGPEALETLLVLGGVAAIAEGGDVVRQRIHPHVNHVLFIPWHRDAPVEAGAADRQVFQSAAHERDDLVTPRLRLDDEFGIVVKLQQLALESGELEKIIFFAYGLRDAATIRAGRTWRGIDVKLIRHAVLAGIAALVDKAALLQDPEKLLHTFAVALFRGADVIVVAQPHAVPKAAELA